MAVSVQIVYVIVKVFVILSELGCHAYGFLRKSSSETNVGSHLKVYINKKGLSANDHGTRSLYNKSYNKKKPNLFRKADRPICSPGIEVKFP